MKLSRREFIKACAASAALSLAAGSSKATGMDLQTPDPEIDKWVKTVCCYCANGDPLLAGIKDGKVVAVKGDPSSPVNYGKICIKGMTLPKVLYAKDRALKPMVRLDASKKGTMDGFEEVSWDKALDVISSKFKDIIKSNGQDALSFYVTGQFYTEAHVVLNKLVKGLIGTNNYDANARLCMASAVGGYVKTLGSDGPPGAFADMEETELFFVIGSNMAEMHPSVFYRVVNQKIKKGAKVIVVDPRKTPTAATADLHLRATRLGTDVALMNAMAHVMISEDLIDPDFVNNHVSGYEDIRKLIFGETGLDQKYRDDPAGTAKDEHFPAFEYSPENVQEITGIPAEDIRKAARMFGKAKTVMSFWIQGLNQSTHGVWNNAAINNLHLITGNIGKPGACAFSHTGQPNAMGERETGSLAAFLPAHRLVVNKKDREETEDFWGVPRGSISPKPGYTALDIQYAALKGDLKALTIWGTNPGTSMPDVNEWRKAMEKLFVVSVDCFHTTESSLYADVILPASMQWAEQTGCFTNSERRVQISEKAVDPPGEAKADWEIALLLAEKMGYGEYFSKYRTTEDIWNDWRPMSTGMYCDMTGITYKRLRENPGIQWPCFDERHPGTVRRYTDFKFTKDRLKEPHAPGFKAKLVLTPHREPAEVPDTDFPLYMTTGRCYEHYHTRTKTGKVADIHYSVPQAWVEINPEDAKRLGIGDGKYVVVESRRGKLTAKSWITDRVLPGTVFVPFHFGNVSDLDGGTDGRNEPESTANLATNPKYDNFSKQPEFKCSAVRIKSA